MIPKIIHLCWFNDDPSVRIPKKCIERIHSMLPDYSVMIWDEAIFDINSLDWTREAYHEKKYAFVSDYVRFYALYKYGGIYLDTDVEIVKSFDDLLNYKFFWGFEYTGCIESAVVGASPRLTWIKKCMKWYETHGFLNLYQKKKVPIAPLIIRDSFESVYSCRTIDDNLVHDVYGGVIFPHVYFSPKNGFRGTIITTEDTYTIHNYNSSWIDKNLFTEAKKKIHIFVIFLFGKKLYNAVTYYILKILYKNSFN